MPTPRDCTGLEGRAVLVTGAARRVGAAIVRRLHAAGADVAIHYRGSRLEAEALADELRHSASGRVMTVQADLLDTERLPDLVETVTGTLGRLDALVNNASTFYPTPVGEITEAHWDDLLGSNLKAPLFLSQAAAPALRAAGGAIVNVVDIYARRPNPGHPVYSVAKAGLAMLTLSLARELGPEVRVNGVAPGAVLWPEAGVDEETRKRTIANTALKRAGAPEDVARTVLFLLADAPYVTGQIIAVDGGRSLAWW